MESDSSRRVLRTAAQLFSRRGFDGVSVQEICDAAGVTKPTLYYYFKSKQALYDRLREDSWQLLQQYMGTARRSDLTVLEQMERAIVEFFRYLEDNEDYVRFIIRMHFPLLLSEQTSELCAHDQYRFQAMSDQLQLAIQRKEIDPHTDIPITVSALIGTLNYIIGQVLMRNRTLDDKVALARRIMDILIKKIPTGQ